jgi:hypothetical protein
VGIPAGVEVLSGNDQVGQVTLALPAPLQVRVVDRDGRGLDGLAVTFEVVDGGGLLGRSARPRVSLLTGSDGRAEVAWTLGARAGLQTVTAVVPPLAPLVFQALALPGPEASLAPVSGGGQRAPLGEELPEPLIVAVRDEFDNAIPGIAVAWEVSAGVGDLSAASVETDSSGRAAVRLTPGSVGEIEVGANLPGFFPVVFTAIGQAVVTDPAGDGFATPAAEHSTPPDLVQVRAWVEAGQLQIKMWYTDFPESGVRGGEDALVGYVDLDTDQNPRTGTMPFTDRLRPGPGSTGLGAEFSVSLFTTSDRFDVLDAAGNLVGTVRSRFAGNTVRMWIPLSLIGDDGLVNLAVVVGTRLGPTDIAPDDGNLAMSPPPGVSR